MSRSALAAGLRHLRGVLAAQRCRDDSDEHLLRAFANQRDEAAFAVLVRRHGPMVLHVCRRVLGHQQDAEDAFQATFLVLARDAAALRNKSALAGFLHGTAYRLSLSVKRAAARRRKHEEQTPARCSADPADELSWREVRALLDEEIARLPDSLRSVLVLCCLENLSQAEAGRRLGLKERTVSSRLAAARKRLSQRLARRGVELTAVLAAVSLAPTSVSALPAGLLASTLQAVLAIAAGEGLAGVVSASVAELVESASVAMMMSKAKLATVALLAVSMLAGASVWAYRAVAINALPSSALPVEPLGAKRDENKAASPKREMPKTVEIKGRVLDPEGKPKAGAKLLLLDEEGKIGQLGVSGSDGRFTAAIPKSERHYDLVAQADGAGIDFIDLEPPKPGKSVELRLVKDNAIRGRVVTTEGKPVRGVRVSVRGIAIYESIDTVLDAWKKRRHLWATTPGRVKSLSIESAELLAATTDVDGRFTLHGIGSERIARLRISGRGIADADSDTMVNRSGFDAKLYNQTSLEDIPKEEEPYFASRTMLAGPDVGIVAEAEKPIHGIVKEADTGKGRPNVVVRLTGITQLQSVSIPLQAKTDALGRYEIHGARKARSYLVRVQSDPAAAYMSCEVLAADTPGYQPVAADITVKKGVIVTGKVIDRATGKSVPGFAEAAPLINNPFAKEYPDFNPFWEGHIADTRADGSFRIVTIPGPVLLMGGLSREAENFDEWIKYKPPSADKIYPQYFSKAPGEALHYHLLGGALSPVQGHFCKVLDIKPGTAVVNQDIVIERASALEMKIEDGEGRPLPGTWAIGFCPENTSPPKRLEGASGTVYGLDTRKPRLLVFYEPVRKIVCTRTLRGDEKPPLVMKLGAVGAFKGRLLDAEGKPLPGVAIDLQYRDREAWFVHLRIGEGNPIVSDAQGAFAFNTVIPDVKFELLFRRSSRKFQREAKPADPTIQIKPGECRDLGAIKLCLASEKAGG